jgi:hypothetical protein
MEPDKANLWVRPEEVVYGWVLVPQSLSELHALSVRLR